MDIVYNLFKFLHIVSAIVWVGGVISVGTLDALVAREKNQAALARQSRYHGMVVIGPAAGLTLIAGIMMIAVSGLGVPLWVIWGFTTIIVSIYGTTLSRPR